MERLTKREGKHTVCIKNEWRRHDPVWDRLAEYEDTGLTPEKIEHMKARLPLNIWLSETPEKMSIFGMTVAELIELSNLKKQGRLYIVDRDEIVEYLLDMIEEEHMGMRAMAIKEIADKFNIEL